MASSKLLAAPCTKTSTSLAEVTTGARSVGSKPPVCKLLMATMRPCAGDLISMLSTVALAQISDGGAAACLVKDGNPFTFAAACVRLVANTTDVFIISPFHQLRSEEVMS